jgi:hypothetical protein
MHFIASLALTTVAMLIFCFGQWGDIRFAGPDSFVPGLLTICVIGVTLGVLALRADRALADGARRTDQ